MPFIRFSRDRRGYEHTYLIHTSSKKGGPTKILYWYRTPPGVKVGRVTFDDVVRRTLEAQYPGVVFDWQKFESTPIPPVEVEHWRERRRSERAAKQARQAAARDDQGDMAEPDQPLPDVGDVIAAPMDIEPLDDVALSEEAADAPLSAGDDHPDVLEEPALPQTAPVAAGPESGAARRRRRRRGGRRRGGSGPPNAAGEPSE